MKIAVTGGLGTGKSTVAKVLANTLATEVIDTDQLCRLHMEPGAEAYTEFVHKHGDQFLHVDGTIDRVMLRQAVFDDEKLRAELESILHPIVQREVEECAKLCQDRGKKLVVEVPLLYEVGWQDRFDLSVVVYVPEKTCIDRVVKRNGLPPEEIKKILAAQMPLSEKCSYAHFVVDNSGTFAAMAMQIAWLTRNLPSK